MWLRRVGHFLRMAVFKNFFFVLDAFSTKACET